MLNFLKLFLFFMSLINKSATLININNDKLENLKKGLQNELWEMHGQEMMDSLLSKIKFNLIEKNELVVEYEGK